MRRQYLKYPKKDLKYPGAPSPYFRSFLGYFRSVRLIMFFFNDSGMFSNFSIFSIFFRRKREG